MPTRSEWRPDMSDAELTDWANSGLTEAFRGTLIARDLPGESEHDKVAAVIQSPDGSKNFIHTAAPLSWRRPWEYSN